MHEYYVMIVLRNSAQGGKRNLTTGFESSRRTRSSSDNLVFSGNRISSFRLLPKRNFGSTVVQTASPNERLTMTRYNLNESVPNFLRTRVEPALQPAQLRWEIRAQIE